MSRVLPEATLASAQRPLPGLRSCQWPLGEPRTPEFRFCCTPLALGQRSSYCPEHQARAYLARPRAFDIERWLAK
jgi:GcrA cell cycle regulator